MRSINKAVAVTAVAAVAVVTIATPVHAEPWDGTNIEFGLGIWKLDNNPFALDDIDVTLDSGVQWTDIWDGAGVTTVTAGALSLDQQVECSSASDIDVSVEAATGDLVISCTSTAFAFSSANLLVASEIRVLSDGETVRFATTITNTGVTDVDIDSVTVGTNFGVSDALFDYDNQSDDVLAVPALGAGGADYTEDLNSVGAQWIVHRNNVRFPGGVIIGGGDADTPAEWSLVRGDDYVGSIGPFAVPAGEARAVVTFATWTPETMLDNDWTINGTPEQSAIALAAIDLALAELVAEMSGFTELTGELANGLDPEIPVINWGPVNDDQEQVEEPELAETGVGDTLALGLVALVLLGVGGTFVARRRATV